VSILKKIFTLLEKGSNRYH